MSASGLARPASFLASLVLAMLLAGCATAPPWPPNAPGHDGALLQQRVLLTKVPFYPQERYQCGPASLATMLNSQGLSTSPQTLKDRVYIPGREGSLQVEMVAAGRDHGMLVYPLDKHLQSLLEEVASGHPVLVLQNLLFDWWPQWHFAVVVGFDGQQQTLILNSGTRKHYEIPVEVFSATWARADSWAVVMLPPDEIPATAKPLAFLAAANDLETTGHTQAALAAYKTAERHWPDQPAPILGQGNIAYANKHLQLAAQQFSRMVTRFPHTAEGWNNLAQTLSEMGCQSGAAKASQCASVLSPERFGQPLTPASTTEVPSCPSLPACPSATDTPDY